MPTQTIPLVGSLTTRNEDPSITTTDQRFENCFFEVTSNSITGKLEVRINKRTGSEATAAITNGSNGAIGAVMQSGLSTFQSRAVFSIVKTGSACGIYTISSTTNTQVGGDIASTSNCFQIKEADVSGVNNLVAVMVDSVTGLREVWYFPEGGAWTQITDGDFPPNQGTPIPLNLNPLAAMDGYLFVGCQNGQIWHSDVNSLANWSAASVIKAQQHSDNGVALARYRNTIVAIGTNSCEFFYNAGNATGSVLSPVANSVRGVGAIRAQGTYIETKSTVFWIGQDGTSGAVGFYRLNGYEPENVAPRDIANQLAAGYKISGALSMRDMSFILLTGSGSTSLLYCIDNNSWTYHKLASSMIPAAVVSSGGLNYYTTASNAIVYGTPFLIAPVVYEDAGVAYSMVVQTAGLDFGTDDFKYATDYWLDADTQASGTTTLEVSDDDYVTWTEIGTFDMTLHEKRITSCDAFTGERAFRLTHSANTAFRGKALRIKYAVAT